MPRIRRPRVGATIESPSLLAPAILAGALAATLGVAQPAEAAGWWPFGGSDDKKDAQAQAPAQDAPAASPAGAATATPSAPAAPAPPATPSAETAPAEEQGRIRVADIAVRGNRTVTEEQILLALPIHRGDEVTRKQVQDALQRLYGLGYFMDVRAFTEDVPGGQRLVFNVVENPELKDVKLSGVTVFNSEEVIKPFQALRGQTLNLREVQKLIKDLEKRYADEGYVLARVIDLQVQPGGVLDLKVAEGEIEAIRVIGNEETRDYVIRRELTLKPGQLFNFKKMEEDLRRVYNLNYFEDLGIKYEPGKTLDKVVIVINVKEKQTGMFQMSAGYSNRDNLLGILSLRKDNLLGRGQSVSADITLSLAGNNSGEVSYFNPWIDERHTSLGVSMYSRRYLNFLNQGVVSKNLLQPIEKDRNFLILPEDSPLSSLTSSSTIETRSGGVVSVGRPLIGDTVTSPLRGTVSIKGEQIDVRRVDLSGRGEAWSPQDTVSYVARQSGRPSPFLLGADPMSGRDNAFSTGLSFTFDTRDLVINPTQGWLSSLSLEQYLGPAIGNLDLTRVNMEVNRYFPISYPIWDLKHTLAIGTKAGTILSLFNHRVPSYERYYSTGPYLIRGWDETLPSAVADPQRAVLFQGDSVAIGSIEYRFPIVSILSGVVFADTGIFWDQESRPTDLSAFNPAHLRSGYGVGVRVNTPLGPLRLDLGVSELYGPKRDDPDRGKDVFFPLGIKPHFSIGQKF